MPDPSFKEPRLIQIFGDPHTTVGRGEWQQVIKKQIKKQQANIEKIKDTCNLDIVFYISEQQYKTSNPPYGPDVDNLEKSFLDGLKGSTLFDKDEIKKKNVKDSDCLITGIRAIKRRAAGLRAQPGVDFRVIPTYTLDIATVEVVEGKEFNRNWAEPMQKITDIDGKEYMDNVPGNLFLNKRRRDLLTKKFSMINPGFDWRKYEGKSIDGVMIFKRNISSDDTPNIVYWLNMWGDL